MVCYHYPTVVLFMAALLVPNTASSPRACPLLCQCVGVDQLEVQCYRLNLTSIPAIDYSMENARLFDFTDNHMTTLTNASFQMYPNLHGVLLSRNGLKTIEVGAFHGIARLQSLNISENVIEYLHPDTFVENPNLQTLVLSGNPLMKLSFNLPITIAPSLQVLDMSFCGLKSISWEMLLGMPNLKILNIQNNSISNFSFETLKKLKHLEQISMKNNNWTCGDCNVVKIFKEMGKRKPDVDTPREVTCAYGDKKVVWALYASRYCNEDDIQTDSTTIKDPSTDWFDLSNETVIVRVQPLRLPVDAEQIQVQGNEIIVTLDGNPEDEHFPVTSIGEVLGGIWMTITKGPFTLVKVLLIVVLVGLAVSFFALLICVWTRRRARANHSDARGLKKINLMLAFDHSARKRDSTAPLLDEVECPNSPQESPVDEPPSLYDEFERTRTVGDHAFSTIGA